jgi:porin
VTAFARVAYSPPDRNLIDLYIDGGVGVSGLVPGRPVDRFGMAVAYMRISDAARNLDRDNQFFAGLPSPVRSNETLLELIYEAHLKPGWLLAPYFNMSGVHPAASRTRAIPPASPGSATLP